MIDIEAIKDRMKRAELRGEKRIAVALPIEDLRALLDAYTDLKAAISNVVPREITPSYIKAFGAYVDAVRKAQVID